MAETLVPKAKARGNSTQRMKAWTTYLQILSHICTALALGGLGLQLWSDSRVRQTERALAYVERFNGDPIATHRDNLERAWLPEQENVGEQNQKGGGLPQIERDRLTAIIMNEFDQLKGPVPSQISIIQMTYFFDQLAICERERLCDDSVVKSYFAAQAKEFWGVYQSKIVAARRAGTTGLGMELQRYVEGPLEK